jgi:hypothetical protein
MSWDTTYKFDIFLTHVFPKNINDRVKAMIRVSLKDIDPFSATLDYGRSLILLHFYYYNIKDPIEFNTEDHSKNLRFGKENLVKPFQYILQNCTESDLLKVLNEDYALKQRTLKVIKDKRSKAYIALLKKVNVVKNNKNLRFFENIFKFMNLDTPYKLSNELQNNIEDTLHLVDSLESLKYYNGYISYAYFSWYHHFIFENENNPSVRCYIEPGRSRTHYYVTPLLFLYRVSEDSADIKQLKHLHVQNVTTPLISNYGQLYLSQEFINQIKEAEADPEVRLFITPIAFKGAALSGHAAALVFMVKENKFYVFDSDTLENRALANGILAHFKDLPHLDEYGVEQFHFNKYEVEHFHFNVQVMDSHGKDYIFSIQQLEADLRDTSVRKRKTFCVIWAFMYLQYVTLCVRQNIYYPADVFKYFIKQTNLSYNIQRYGELLTRIGSHYKQDYVIKNMKSVRYDFSQISFHHYFGAVKDTTYEYVNERGERMNKLLKKLYFTYVTPRECMNEMFHWEYFYDNYSQYDNDDMAFIKVHTKATIEQIRDIEKKPTNDDKLNEIFITFFIEKAYMKEKIKKLIKNLREVYKKKPDMKYCKEYADHLNYLITKVWRY